MKLNPVNPVNRVKNSGLAVDTLIIKLEKIVTKPLRPLPVGRPKSSHFPQCPFSRRRNENLIDSLLFKS
jgi:hypothetical protein